MDLTNRQQLISYMQEHGLYTRKSLGQNFLVDRSALEKIVEAAKLSKDDCVIEVGPGLGALTDELVKQAGKVVAVELDKTLAELLEERFLDHDPQPSLLPEGEGTPATGATGEGRGEDNDSYLTVVNSNILDVNIGELVGDCPSYKVVANIPYYITSKILRFFLETEKKPETIVLLTQKEVAERVCAKPGDMSVLSVSVQAYGRPEIIDIVKKDSFFPAPEVDSAILKISNIESRISKQIQKFENLENSKIVSDFDIRDSNLTEKDFFRCVHIGFASRRKTLLNNLSAGYHLDKKTTLGILVSVGLNDKTRAQELSVEEWKKLCREF